MNLRFLVVAFCNCLLFLSTGVADAQSTTLENAGLKLHKAQKASLKSKKKAEAYLAMAQVYENPLKKYELAIGYYLRAAAKAKDVPKKRQKIEAEAEAGRARAAAAWLRTLESPTFLEMTADTATKYYSQPSSRTGPHSGVKLPKPKFLVVEEFRNGFCRVVVRQGSVTKDAWFRLQDVDSFRVVPSGKTSVEETLQRYEQFLAIAGTPDTQTRLSSRMDELSFEQAKIKGTSETLQAYLSRFPNGEHRNEALALIEKNRFEEAQSADNRKSYTAYLAEYPAGAFVEEAHKKIEDLAFKKCRSKTGCEEYLTEYAQGRHVSAAREKIESFLFEEAKDSESLESLKSFIQLHPQSRHRSEAAKEIDRLTFASYRASSSTIDLQRFIQDHPQNRHVAEARRLIDLSVYKPFQDRDTIEAYLDFLDQHPKNFYRSTAEIRIDELQFEPYQNRNSIREYEKFLLLFPKNRNAGAARKAISKLRVAHVRNQVQAINQESRNLGNRYNVTFSSFSNGVLTVRIPAPSTGGQLLRLFVGGVDDVQDTQRRYNEWRRSIIRRLNTINGVDRVTTYE